MVIGSEDTLCISSEHRSYGTAGKQCPCVGGSAVDFAVFAAFAARPGGTDDENVACGDGGLGLVATGNLHSLGRMLAECIENPVSICRVFLRGFWRCAYSSRRPRIGR